MNQMAIELVPTTRDHSDEVANICFEAYKDLTDRHNFPQMFPSTGVTRQAYSDWLDNRFSYGVTAMLNDRPIGSAFAWTMDEVVGIGPVSVDPASQGAGAAKAMMQHLVDYSKDRGYDKIRLSQRAYNPVSLSVYASIGFDVKESFMEMRAAPTPDPLQSVRPYDESDLPSLRDLSKRIYKVDRGAEIESSGHMLLVRERGAAITGYFSGEFGFGHGVAESDDDMLALVGEFAIRNPENAKFNCPLSSGELYRKFLKAGCRAVEMHTLMAYGPYEQPEGAWLISALY